MSYDARDTMVGKLFHEKMEYEVPRYQRNYVWRDENWEDLLRDIIFSYKNSSGYGHFLGTFVFEDVVHTSSSDPSKKYIIDGQQRMTTLQIVIFSLIYILKKKVIVEERNGNTEKIEILFARINALSDYIMFIDDVTLKKRIKIENGIESFKSLASLSVTNTKSVKDINIEDYEKISKDNINRAFIFITRYLETNIANESNYLESLVNFQAALFDMKLITVSSSNEQEVINLFEVLNARGLYLKQSELLKNYIFRKLDSEPFIDKVKIDWKKMEEDFYNNDIDLDDYIFHFMRAYYDIKDLKKEKIYQSLKSEELKSKEENIKHLYNKINNYYEYYLDIVKNTNSTDCESNVFEYFIIKKNKQIRSLVLSLKVQLINGVITEKQYNEFINTILNYFVGFNLGQQKSNQIDSDVTSASNKIYWSKNFCEVNKNFLWFIMKVSKHYPTNTVLCNHIMSIRYSNKNKKGNTKKALLVYYFKHVYEKLKHEDDIKIPYNKLSIEHIIPDSMNDEKTWLIGNLLLTTKKINNKLSNKSYDKKRDVLKLSDIGYNREFSEKYNNFDFIDVEKRTEELKSSILSNFKIDFIHYEQNYKIESKHLEIKEFIQVKFDKEKADELVNKLEKKGVNEVVRSVTNNKQIDEKIRNGLNDVIKINKAM